MSFLCNFPLYSKNNAPLETDTLFSIALPTKKKQNTSRSSSTYSNEKEIRFNEEEQEKVIYVKKAETFDLKLQISGETILKNLVLTAKASHNCNPLPVKCQWRRFKSESERKNIKDINSFSYMPNSEDIGFSIEVEVESLDNINDIAIARYGPINITSEIENIITQLISYEKRYFNLKSCNEKIKNNNFILDLHKNEIKLINIDQSGKKNIIERCKYSLVNPSLELSNTNMTKFKISFIQPKDLSKYSLISDCNFNLSSSFLTLVLLVINNKLSIIYFIILNKGIKQFNPPIYSILFKFILPFIKCSLYSIIS